MIHLSPARNASKGGIVAMAIMVQPMIESQIESDDQAMRIPTTPISMQKNEPNPR